MRHPQTVCPFLDRREEQCAGFLTMTNLREAFRRCASDHESCTVYHTIRLNDERHEQRLLAACSA